LHKIGGAARQAFVGVVPEHVELFDVIGHLQPG